MVEVGSRWISLYGKDKIEVVRAADGFVTYRHTSSWKPEPTFTRTEGAFREQFVPDDLIYDLLGF